MALYGYARVSSTDQDLTTQVEKLTAAGCTIIRHEKASATSREGRKELDILLAFLRAGDVLMVTKIDRLARSVRDLQEIVETIKGKGADLKATDQPIDTSAAGRLFVDILSCFASFETALRAERQRDGIIRAKARGVYKGRKPSIDTTEIKRLREVERLGPSEIAKRLKIGRASVYRLLAT
jgi:DNA invertase Pin-like site-specific DNA recombinase